jgi:hypothetical protein
VTTAPRFAAFAPRTGGYESYYVRAVDPYAPRGLWLRHTIHQAPGTAPVGSIWVTLFDARKPAPVTHKVSLPRPEALPDGVRIGDSAFGAGGVCRDAGAGASWELRWEGGDAPLRHLPKAWMYTAPLPRTKLESPLPAVRVLGRIACGDTVVEVDRWPGMVGHNWGTQHAERWIWLHGTAFQDRPGDWLDLALGRVRLGRATTPWVANGALTVDGERLALGGLRARPRVDAAPGSLELDLDSPAARLHLTVTAPRPQTVVWRYADPGGDEHHVANCSIAELELTVQRRGAAPLTLRTAHGGAYELGMRETTHGLPVQPFGDP